MTMGKITLYPISKREERNLACAQEVITDKCTKFDAYLDLEGDSWGRQAK